MEVGNLYQSKNLYWLLYSSRDTAVRLGARLDRDQRAAARSAAFWSREFGCKVGYIEPKSVFMILEQDGIVCKILSTEGNIGWIILAEWCKVDIEEVKVE